MLAPGGRNDRGAHFLVLGAGGLGCPALLGLVAAGARRITIVDRDRVELSNLQRQVLFDVGDVGALKAEAAVRSLARRARGLELRGIVADVDEAGLLGLLGAAPAGTVVLECSDDPGLKFMVNDACLSRQVPAVIAGAQRWRGQALALGPGLGACIRCVYEAPPPVELRESCAEVGVIGAAVGLFGELMALLAWRLACEPAAVAGALIALDLLRLEIHTLRPRPRPGCPACAGLGIQDDARPGRACATRSPSLL